MTAAEPGPLGITFVAGYHALIAVGMWWVWCRWLTSDGPRTIACRALGHRWEPAGLLSMCARCRRVNCGWCDNDPRMGGQHHYCHVKYAFNPSEETR